MRNFLRILIVFGIMLYSPGLQAADMAICKDELSIPFDGRDWKKDFEQSAQEAAIVEYTLKDESVQNWSELVTIQKFSPLEVPVEEYYKEYMKLLKKSVHPSVVDSKVLNKNESTIFFKWWIDEKGPNNQHEWFKFFKTPQASYVLRYTTKKFADDPNKGAAWQKILEDAAVNPNASCTEDSLKAPSHD